MTYFYYEAFFESNLYKIKHKNYSKNYGNTSSLQWFFWLQIVRNNRHTGFIKKLTTSEPGSQDMIPKNIFCFRDNVVKLSQKDIVISH